MSPIKGLVSVIIPTYNRADFVVEAIRSVQAQTYSAKQIIVIDDGSRDATRSRVAGIEGVEYYFQDNRGQGAARNYGLSFARGEFIASLDSDDVWEPDFLAHSIECLESFKLDFVFSNWNKIRAGEKQPSEWLQNSQWKPYQTQRQGDWWLLNPAQVRKLFLAICPAPSSSLVARRSSIVSGWGERMQIADDWYLLLEMALHRRCAAAFDLTPRWNKRIDGNNVYDGQSAVESIRKLYLHDSPIFRECFAGYLTRREKWRLDTREYKYRAYLRLREHLRGDFAVRWKLFQAAKPARLLVKKLIG